jgi:hypothetical protein
MDNPNGLPTGLGQRYALPTYPRAPIVVDFAGPDGQPQWVAHRSLDNAERCPQIPQPYY